MKLLILAGGSGTRLWPLSRVAKPKQVQPFLDKHTLLQHTWGRLRRSFAAGDIFISTTAEHARQVQQQLPELHAANLIIEPVGRNTAAAIGLAARVIYARYPREVVATVNSDHYVAKSLAFAATLKRAERVVRAHPGTVTLVGVGPSYPETGYGYIRMGRTLGTGVYTVAKFTEKPVLARARTFVASGRYLWNTGLFVFYPQELLTHYATLMPGFTRRLLALPLLPRAGGGVTVSRTGFMRLAAESIDYAVLEKLTHLAVVRGNFDWVDVGHWRTIFDILQRGQHGNVVRGQYVGLNSQRNLVYSLSGKLIATVGLSDHVIVETDDALLVCPRERTQDVRQLVQHLRKLGLSRYL